MAVVSSVVLGAAAIGSAVVKSKAAQSAAKKQVRAGNQAIGTQEEFNESATERLNPFVDLGLNAASGGGGEDPNSILGEIRNEDNLTFERGQGFDQINKAAAAGGKGLFSGQRGKDLVEFDRGLRTRDKNNRVNQLLALIQGGQSAASGQANADLRTGENISSIQIGKGNALAAARVAKGNAFSEGIQGVASAAVGGITNGASFLSELNA